MVGIWVLARASLGRKQAETQSLPAMTIEVGWKVTEFVVVVKERPPRKREIICTSGLAPAVVCCVVEVSMDVYPRDSGWIGARCRVGARLALDSVVAGNETVRLHLGRGHGWQSNLI